MDPLTTVNIQTTTNKYLAPDWVDLILQDNFFFGYILENTKKWDGSRMDFPIKYQKGVASVAFSGFDQLPTSQQPVSVNMSFYPKLKNAFAMACGVVKSFLIYGETPNYAAFA